MADTISVGGKKFPKKPALIAIGGVIVVGGVVYYRKQQTASADAATTSDTTSADQSGIDPATGFPYGSAEDSAALAQFSVGPGLPVNTAGGSSGTGGDIGPGSFTNNAQWAQAFENQVGSTGNDAIAAALGKYLTASVMDSSQVQIIQEAIASQGFPPVAGAGGFPPSYHTKPDAKPPPPPKTKKTHEVIADGHHTLRDMATASGTTTYAQAQKLNPWAHRFTVKTRNIPKGYHVKLYVSK
jgi:hypothetical protein